MKKLHTHAIFVLAFMLGVAFPVTAIVTANNQVFAAEQTEGSSTTAADEDAFFAAAQNNAITSITLSGSFTVSAKNNGILIERTAPLTINLNGNNITTANDTIMTIAQGNVTITGSGTMASVKTPVLVKGSITSTDSNYTVVTIGQDVTLHGNTEYGLAIVPMSTAAGSRDNRCYGVVVNFNGKADGAYGIGVNGSIQDTQNAPQINIGNTAQLTAAGNDKDNAPIYAAGYANWTIGSATLTGKMGIGLKAGTFTLNGTKLTANGEFNGEPTTGTNGIDGTGVAFQIEHQSRYANEDIVININGGTYTSSNDVFYEYGDTATTRSITAPADINITGGTFTAGEGNSIFGGSYEDDDIVISGGTFKGDDVNSFQTNGYLASNLTIDSNGNVVVATSGGSSSRPNRPTTPDNTAPSTPDDDNKKPSEDNKKPDDTTVPDTGINQGLGIISAVSTIVPILLGSGALFMLYSKKLVKNRQAERLDDMVSSINAQSAPVEAADEPTIERFEAVAIDRPATPEADPVDTFINRTK